MRYLFFKFLYTPGKHCVARSNASIAAALLLLAASTLSAAANFRLCNNTAGRVGVAIGYRDQEGWTTEGWWNISPHSCETLLHGTLLARYYYIYALDYDRGGEWSGNAPMCSREKEFTIRGRENCLARGYDLTGFFEVDTGSQRSWTVQLTDSPEQNPNGQSPVSGAPILFPQTPQRGLSPLTLPASPAESKKP